MKEKTTGFFGEFKQFIARGNVMDMAVGVIIGGAFSSITTSLINDIIMPILGIFTGSISFADMAVEVNGAVIGYGNFIQAVLNFLVMAFVVFCLVRTINRLHRKKEAAPAAPPAPPEPSNEEKLLTEIRDLLKERR
ncbi:large-conductance mechanosensitive channel protein MscL [uncultured Oscillibacter sp.]|uniref:large-conductance mechanosensitive channel protein MscL n=1 Tax=uncultured Oscillibacter sp. TaxID=876091 RepID=UPI00261365A4|nr:large-conductance mechanosensitive channel protein MscL [uncultured Oscillibacter sp.]